MMDSIWQSAWDFLAVHIYVSPFWYWAFVGAGVIFVTGLISMYFPVLRSLGGAIAMSVIVGLVGYRRGETDAEQHDQKKKTTSLW